MSHLHLSLFLTFSLKAGGSTAGAPTKRNPLRRSCVSSERNAGESAICPGRGQPSAEIVRVQCAKCRRECDFVLSRATLCGDRACQAREMQARVRFVPVRDNRLRRSCVSSARNAGESAICPGLGQPSAEIVRVECAKCRRECDFLVLSRATLCGDRACRGREAQARVRFAPVRDNPLRRSCVSSARSAGESVIWFCRGQPSAEIVRVECAKCRRECDFLVLSRATLCGDRACRGREAQARVRFAPVRDNPLRRSCVSSARSAGESAICRGRGQPSAGIVRIEQARVRFDPVRRKPLRRSCVSSAGNAGESAFWIGRAPLLEEVLYATLVLETWRFTFGGSLVGNAGVGASFMEEVSYETPQIYLSTPTHPHIGVAISHLRLKPARRWLEQIPDLVASCLRQWKIVCNQLWEQPMLAVAGDKSMHALLHCFGGINRSAGILCAWLVVACEHSALEAVQLLVQKRPALRPWRNRPYALEALWHLEGLRAEWQRDFSATHRD